jgi:homoserine kinase
MNDQAWYKATAPASLSNLGPGFDALGLCIDTHVDIVEAARTTEAGISIESIDGLYSDIPLDPSANTAAVAAAKVLEISGDSGGLRLKITKGIPLGSGIGGSAASAAAGARVAGAALGLDPASDAVLQGALEGESLASGSQHGDNVLPSLFGGLVATTPSDPSHYLRIAINAQLSLSLVLPAVTIFTKQARSRFPKKVPFQDAIVNAAATARIVASIVNGNWKELGRSIMVDRIVEPIRAAMIPSFDQARSAALKAGAYGVAVSGSGPALFAVCAHDAHARRVSRAISATLSGAGIDAITFVAHPSNEGCTVGPSQ